MIDNVHAVPGSLKSDTCVLLFHFYHRFLQSKPFRDIFLTNSIMGKIHQVCSHGGIFVEKQVEWLNEAQKSKLLQLQTKMHAVVPVHFYMPFLQQ